MPELPEVETYRKYIEEALFESPISQIVLLRKKILKTDLQEFQERLIGQRFVDTKRIGKYLFLKVESDAWVLLHFGMTGKISYFTDEALMPQFTRLFFEFESGLKLAFINMRLFGKVQYISNLEQYLKSNNIGVDALEVSETTFITYLKQRRSAIKTVLLHQKAFAGIGNWIADEILFQAAIHPEIKANQLSEKQLKLVFDKTMHILETAVKQEANYKNFPEYFMVGHRWGDGRCPECDKELKRIVVGGRGTYLCERRQILK